MRLQQTYTAHSGYYFKDTLFDAIGLAHCHSTVFHDHHHTSNQGNFGSEIMDWLCGTMDHFVQGGEYDGYANRKVRLASTNANEGARTKKGD